MTDPMTPPPRRPAPESLRRRVDADLDASAGSSRRLTAARLAIPVAAAIVLVALALGLPPLLSTRLAEPASQPASTDAPTMPAGPAPTATSSVHPHPHSPPTSTSTPLAADLDVRGLTTDETTQDAASCLQAMESDQGTWQGSPIQLARLMRRAGQDGPGQQVRVLVHREKQGIWVCEDGTSVETMSTALQRQRGATTPAVQVQDSIGSDGSCDKSRRLTVDTSGLFEVDDSVVLGRTRLVINGKLGPWQASRPSQGMVYLPVELTGDDVWQTDVVVDYQLLDRQGDPVEVQPWGDRDVSTTDMVRYQMRTCGDARTAAPR